MRKPRIVLNMEDHRDLKVLAAKRGSSLEALVGRIVRAYLKRFRSAS